MKFKLLVAVLASSAICFGIAITASWAQRLSEASPGAALQQRQALLDDLVKAERLGVGTGPYRKAFESIEATVKSAGASDEIQRRTERLHQALKVQLGRINKSGVSSLTTRAPSQYSGMPHSRPGETTPTTPRYYTELENYLMPKIIPVGGLKGTTRANVKVSANGTISAVDILNGSPEPPAVQARIKQKILALKNVPAPPASIEFQLFVSDDHKKFQLTADPDFGTYMADLQRRIKKHWFPPKGKESERIATTFTVSRSGGLSGLRLKSASNNEAANKAAVEAIQDAAPFRPLPDGSPNTVDIQFTFDFNVFNGRGSGNFHQF